MGQVGVNKKSRKGIRTDLVKFVCDADLCPIPERGRKRLQVKVGDRVSLKTFSGGERPDVRTGTVTYIHPEHLFASVKFCTDYGRSYEVSFANVNGKLAGDSNSYMIKD